MVPQFETTTTENEEMNSKVIGGKIGTVAKTREQYTKAWLAHAREMHYALCWDLMDKQSAEQSAALEAAFKVYADAIERASEIVEA